MIDPVVATNPAVDERARLMRAAQQLEAVFTRQMLQAMRDASPAAGLVEQSSGERIFTAMFDDAMADGMVAQNPRGLAAALYRQLSRHLPPEAADPAATHGPVGAIDVSD